MNNAEIVRDGHIRILVYIESFDVFIKKFSKFFRIPIMIATSETSITQACEKFVPKIKNEVECFYRIIIGKLTCHNVHKLCYFEKGSFCVDK